VLALRFTADGKFVAAALLDHTVKVHFVDSFKFFLSLYGHRLPVMAIDTSSDGALLVSGSSDKNVKIWGLDFGDCHRSLFAHDDAVMAVAFQRNTHYFFSGGKDGRIKYWDADSAELILVLEGHHGPVWSLAMSSEAGEPFVVSGGADRTWRVWERTEALVFAEEERELRLEARLDAADLERAEHGAGIVDERETTAAARDTAESLKAAERLARSAAPRRRRAVGARRGARAKRARIEDVNVADAVAPTRRRHALVALYDDNDAATLPNQLLLGLTPSRYVLRQLRDIRRGELDAALLALPLDHCISLLRYVLRWLEKGIAVELATRMATFVVRSHAGVLARSTMHAALLGRAGASLDRAPARVSRRDRLQRGRTAVSAARARVAKRARLHRHQQAGARHSQRGAQTHSIDHAVRRRHSIRASEQILPMQVLPR
jgi:U3 small nucleolar RNA-associated protein 12